MKLFHSPGSCSLGIQILLEEVKAAYDLERINLRKREQTAAAFLRINPKGKVPALLRDDGTILTEFQAIAVWIAKSYPKHTLMGTTAEAEIRTLELLDYIVGSVHMRGITLVIMPMKFLKSPEGQAELRSFGVSEVKKGLKNLSETLADSEFLLDGFSIADAALFYVLRFARDLNIELPGNLEPYYQRLMQRPSVAAAFPAEFGK